MDLLLSGCIATKLDRKLLGALGVRMIVSLTVGMGPHQPSLSLVFPVGCSLRVFPEVPGSPQTIWPSGAPRPPGGRSLALFFFPTSDSDCSRFPIGSPSDQTVAPLPSHHPPKQECFVVLKMLLCLLWGERRMQAGEEEKTGVG